MPAGMPDDFLWGAATASYQIEGATTEDGRGESVWDRFAATPGKVKHGDTGEPACDHYHRYPDDVALMQRLGLGAYRFSIAWPRILPEGTGQVNDVGLDFYDRLTDTLLEAGIRPFATLYHWDLPQTLQDRFGGWTSRDIAEVFANYADIVSRRLGDRIKDWITLNEPWVVSWLGHGFGIHAPGLAEPALILPTAHHQLLAHGQAVPILRRNSPGARVGITLNLAPVEPATDTAAHRDAARAVDGALNRWFLDALFHGRYPADTLQDFASQRLAIEPGDLAAIATPLDFLGINYYAPQFVHAAPNAAGAGAAVLASFARAFAGERGEAPPRPELERTATGWPVVPEGLTEILTRVHREYAPPAIFITENGAAFDDVVTPDGAVHDARRISYLDRHFAAARHAIEEGVPLKGYFVWSLLDNFEWSEGYSKRFGIVYVDYATQERVAKDSGHWYATLLGGSA